MMINKPLDEENELDNDEDLDEDELLDGEEDELPKAPPSEFALQLRPRLEKIMGTLEQKEAIEFEPEKRELLFDEMTEAAENARNPKAILKAIMYALIKSDNVEEIYGSDQELLAYIKESISM